MVALNAGNINPAAAVARMNPLPADQTADLATWVANRGSGLASLTAFLFDFTGKALTAANGAANPDFETINTGRDHAAQAAPHAGAVTIAGWAAGTQAERDHAAYALIKDAIIAIRGMDVRRAFMDLVVSSQVKAITTRRIKSYYASEGAEVDSDLLATVVNHWGKVLPRAVDDWAPTLIGNAWGRYRLTIASCVNSIAEVQGDFARFFSQAEVDAVSAYLRAPYDDPLLRAIPERAKGKAKAILMEIGRMPEGTHFLAKARLAPHDEVRIRALTKRLIAVRADVTAIANMNDVAAIEAAMVAMV